MGNSTTIALGGFRTTSRPAFLPNLRLRGGDLQEPLNVDYLAVCCAPIADAGTSKRVSPHTRCVTAFDRRQLSSKARTRCQCSSALPSGRPSRSHSA